MHSLTNILRKWLIPKTKFILKAILGGGLILAYFLLAWAAAARMIIGCVRCIGHALVDDTPPLTCTFALRPGWRFGNP